MNQARQKQYLMLFVPHSYSIRTWIADMMWTPLNPYSVFVVLIWVRKLNVTVIILESFVKGCPIIRLIRRAHFNKISAWDSGNMG